MSNVPPSFVIDASVGVKLFLPEESAENAQRFVVSVLADQIGRLHVPDLFFVECANVLWKAVNRLGYPLENAIANLASLKTLGLMATPTQQLAERALEIGCRFGLTAYDACYVALSDSLSIPLVTADERLVAKLEVSIYNILSLNMI